MRRWLWLLVGALALAAVPAHAQNNFPTPGGAVAPGSVLMCANAAGNAIPCNFTPAIVSGSATTVTASATGTTAATTATLPATATTTTYICGFDIAATATAAAAGNATVTNAGSGTMNFEMGTGLAPAVVHTTETFNPCLPATAVNTSIAVVSAAPGTGGVISVTAWGYQK